MPRTAAELFQQLKPELRELLENPENTSLQTLRMKLGFKELESCNQFELIASLKQQRGINATMTDIVKIAQIGQLFAKTNQPEAKVEPEEEQQEQSSPFRP